MDRQRTYQAVGESLATGERRADAEVFSLESPSDLAKLLTIMQGIELNLKRLCEQQHGFRRGEEGFCFCEVARITERRLTTWIDKLNS